MKTNMNNKMKPTGRSSKRGACKELMPVFDQSLIEVDCPEDASAILEEYGICIVKSLLDENECEGIRNGMIRTLEHLTSKMATPFQYNDTKAWKTLSNLMPRRHMMYQHWGVGHAQFLWDLRCNPKVVNAFASLWGTDDLLVSFDGFSFHLPPEILGEGWQDTTDKWWHVDQSFLKAEKACVQGLINGNDTNLGDATLEVIVGSHKFHSTYGEDFHVYNPKDWYMIPNPEYFLEKGCQEHRITCPKGSLVLWDSRTVHYGSGAIMHRSQPNLRTVCYVCYTPSDFITEGRRREKINMFETQRVTNHWPHAPEAFTVKPSGKHRPAATDVNPLPMPTLDKRYYKLIGYNDYEIEEMVSEST